MKNIECETCGGTGQRWRYSGHHPGNRPIGTCDECGGEGQVEVETEDEGEEVE